MARRRDGGGEGEELEGGVRTERGALGEGGCINVPSVGVE